MTHGMLSPSPACGGESGKGAGHKPGACGRAPSPALPRERGRGQAAPRGISVPRAVSAVCCTASFLLAPSAPPARAEHLVSSLSSHIVKITSNFTGVELTLFGTVENGPPSPPAGSYDIVVTVTGPRQSVVAFRKERMFGVWINATSRRFVDVPSYLAVLSTRPFDVIAGADTLRRDEIGIANIPLKQAGEAAAAAPGDPFRQAFVDLKTERRLYGETPNGVTFLTPTLYRAAIFVPAEAAIGDYEVGVKLFSAGAMIARAGEAFEIRTVGFERFMANAAVNYGLAYGLATTAMAVLTGWMASILFRRD
jgi:uncharacterized protein (TIGR02186 family)